MKEKDDEPRARRGDDVNIRIGPVEVGGSSKAVTQLLTGTLSVFALVGVVVWHIIDTNRFEARDIEVKQQILDHMKAQTLLLLTTQNERPNVVPHLPKAVRDWLRGMDGQDNH